MTRKIEVWDKLAGRHWNKWIISVILPEEDMPYSADGQPIDIILNPHWVISRMNIGQSFESQLWLVWKALWVNFAVPLFSDFSVDDIRDLLKNNNLPEDWKVTLFDGRTWEQFVKPITIWYMYMLKLDHMVEDKIHARSVGPYSLITRQPLQGKARSWWQRFWEMEVWALEAYGAVHTLQEMLTIKSDDMAWRNKAYESIIKWFKVKNAWTPESYNLLVKLLQGLGQNITTLTRDEKERIYEDRLRKIQDLGLRWVTAAPDMIDEIWATAHDSFDGEEETDQKDLMKNIIEDLVDYWQIEE
jgi:DNA-directed RNA polymerase subunit beta